MNSDNVNNGTNDRSLEVPGPPDAETTDAIKCAFAKKTLARALNVERNCACPVTVDVGVGNTLDEHSYRLPEV